MGLQTIVSARAAPMAMDDMRRVVIENFMLTRLIYGRVVRAVFGMWLQYLGNEERLLVCKITQPKVHLTLALIDIYLTACTLHRCFSSAQVLTDYQCLNITLDLHTPQRIIKQDSCNLFKL